MKSIILGVALLAGVSAVAQTNQPSTHRFENVVRLYEAADKTNPPPRNAILLAGDSQFYRWKTVNEDLPVTRSSTAALILSRHRTCSTLPTGWCCRIRRE
jgi:hypothetical protein